MFKPAAMPVLEFLPALIKGTSVRAWDLASSTPGDYTVGLKLALRQEDRLPIIIIQRMRGRPEEVRRLVKTIADADTSEVKIMLPQDPAQVGADQIQSYIEMLRGYRVEAVHEQKQRAARRCRRFAVQYWKDRNGQGAMESGADR
jgi:phage terminase large subunit-like protein